MPGNMLKIGDKARLSDTGEFGVVVWTWVDDFLDVPDCYVAFFGESWPEGKPKEIPYVLRYLQAGLEKIEEP